MAVMLEKYEICCGIFHGSIGRCGKRADRRSGSPYCRPLRNTCSPRTTASRELTKAVTELSKAFALAVPHEEALAIRDDVAFFQAVKAVLTKSAGGDRRSPEEIDHAIRQIVSRAVASDEVIDIFAAAGLKKPDISILSDEFLAEVRGMPQRNLAVEMLRKLLERGDQDAGPQEHRPGAVIRRDAGKVDQTLPEPGHRDGTGDRGTDRPGQATCGRPTGGAKNWG